jgi:uncharacterized protein YdiU (UPF0061 family)
LDYGPFGFLERFDPLFCPWVGGGDEYSFSRQPQAIAINLSILAEAFAEVLRVRGAKGWWVAGGGKGGKGRGGGGGGGV